MPRAEHAAARRPTCAAWARRCSSPSRASRRRAAAGAARPISRRPTPICLIQSFYAMAVRLARRARPRRRPAAPSQQGHAHPMSAPRCTPCGRGAARLRRRRRARGRRRADRGRAASPTSGRARDLPAAVPVRDLPDGAWLAPGFIDLQVNGGGDVLFNDDADGGGHRARSRAAHRRFGTTGLLPTLISDTPDKMRAALAAAPRRAPAASRACSASTSKGRSCRPSKPGVHDRAMFRAPEPRRSRRCSTAWPTARRW